MHVNIHNTGDTVKTAKEKDSAGHYFHLKSISSSWTSPEYSLFNGRHFFLTSLLNYCFCCQQTVMSSNYDQSQCFLNTSDNPGCQKDRKDSPSPSQTIGSGYPDTHSVNCNTSSVFPARSLGFTIFSERFFFVHVTIFYPIIEVVTFSLHGKYMLGVFLLLEIIHLGHTCLNLLSQCNGICVQRPYLGLHSHRKK